MMNSRWVRGNMLVEAAFLLPLVLALIIGVLEIGRALLGYSVLTYAVREAARKAAVERMLTPDDPEVLARLDSLVTRGGFTVSTSSVQYAAPLQTGRLVRVSAGVDLNPITALVFPVGVIPLQTSTVIRYER